MTKGIVSLRTGERSLNGSPESTVGEVTVRSRLRCLLSSSAVKFLDVGDLSRARPRRQHLSGLGMQQLHQWESGVRLARTYRQQQGLNPRDVPRGAERNPG